MTASLAWLFADADAIEEVRALAEGSGFRIEAFTDGARAAKRYAQAPPALLLFAHVDLALAERAFLELFRTAPGFAGGDHPSILLCRGQDADLAYDLVRRGVFDDYVVFRPLYDPHRLAISIRHLTGARRGEDQAAAARRQLAAAQTGASALHGALTRQAQASEAVAADLAAARQRLVAAAPELHPVIEAACSPAERRLVASSAEARNTAAAVAPQLSQAAAWLAQQPQRLVVVDDDPVYLKVLASMLESAGYEVRAFTDPQGALVALPRLKPDAVLVDVEMPGIGGLELIAAAKRVPALAGIPYLVITGHADAETVRAAAQHGVAGFIVKPGQRAAVLSKLREALPPPMPPEIAP
ncbi:response regulator [Sulfuricystis multivorans]|uniref:response regulator n=1 Tax=Sulfuricystis multivorans TaxID=2211108 RepID=UPI000F84385D|nr:response regulator [Sulfuricystis multivorans]